MVNTEGFIAILDTGQQTEPFELPQTQIPGTQIALFRNLFCRCAMIAATTCGRGKATING